MTDKNRLGSIAAIFALCSISGLAAAQGAAPAGKKDEQKAPAMEIPKPAPELDQLKVLEGTWNCDGTMPAGAMGPGSPAQSVKSTMKMKKSLDGFWYMTDYEEKKTKTHPVAIKAHGPMGFDPTAKKFVMMGVDNMGGYVTETSTGWEGDKMVLTGDGMLMGQKASVRDTITKKGNNELVWASDMKMGGAADFSSMGEQHCKRAAAK
jgi:hypothetical protein